jgi:hypothetical protein
MVLLGGHGITQMQLLLFAIRSTRDLTFMDGSSVCYLESRGSFCCTIYLFFYDIVIVKSALFERFVEK